MKKKAFNRTKSYDAVDFANIVRAAGDVISRHLGKKLVIPKRALSQSHIRDRVPHIASQLVPEPISVAQILVRSGNTQHRGDPAGKRVKEAEAWWNAFATEIIEFTSGLRQGTSDDSSQPWRLTQKSHIRR